MRPTKEPHVAKGIPLKGSGPCPPVPVGHFSDGGVFLIGLRPTGMNLYVLFAIALGAISGFTEPAAGPRVMARVVNECGAEGDRLVAGSARVTTARHGSTASIASPAAAVFVPEAPLSGAATPRAPSPRS